MSMPAGPIWTVAQIGAREEYAAARAFVPAGRLRALYTDVWCRHGAGVLRHGPAPLRVLAGRYHASVPPARVRAFSPTALADRALRMARLRRRATNPYDEHLRVGRWFDGRVLGRLRRGTFDPAADVFFAYDTGCLECVRWLRGRGVLTVVDQIDAARVGYDLAVDEERKWPGWAAAPVRAPDRYFDRLAAEWAEAEAVVVNSAWSAAALTRQGVPPDKVHVVPLAYEPPPRPAPARRPHDRPLTVLWLGNVILAKGIQYLIGAAARLTARPIRFLVVGPVGVTAAALAAAPPGMAFVGKATRDRVAAYYAAADLFVLPTLSDGFALTQLEAMAHGLPVVATPNCGAVVDDGVDGLIVPAGDAAALAAAVVSLDDDRDRLAAMSERAVVKSRAFSLAVYAERLDAVARRCRPGAWPDA